MRLPRKAAPLRPPGEAMMTTMLLDRNHHNAANCVRSLISVTEALNELIGKENDAISAGRPDDVGPFQAEKARLAATHARSIKTLSANRAAFCAVDESLLIELRAHTETFEMRIQKQQMLLETPAPAPEG